MRNLLSFPSVRNIYRQDYLFGSDKGPHSKIEKDGKANSTTTYLVLCIISMTISYSVDLTR